MCTEAEVVKGSERIYCETVGALANALGIPIGEIKSIGPSAPEADDCLCGIRWNELGARRATDEEGWPFPGYIIEMPSAAAEEVMPSDTA